MNELLVIVPAFNEEDNLEQVISSLRSEAKEYDILVVDDGSTDNTSSVARRLGVKLICHRVNLGLWEAVRTGMRYAVDNDYSYVIQFDADGQHDASAIRRMYNEALRQGTDIMIGSRYIASPGAFSIRTAGSRLISWCIMMTVHTLIKDPTSGMRLYERRVVELFASSGYYTPEPDTLAYLAGKGFKIAETEVVMHDRNSGRSYLDITESIRYMFRMCTSIFLLQWMRGGEL